MKLHQAQSIIERHENTVLGYAVRFERRDNGMLCSDHFPDIRFGELAIPTEQEAWELARRFASTDPNGLRYVNIYVIRAADFRPVDGYDERRLNRHPKRISE